MAGKSTCNELERKNRHLEKEVLAYIRKAKQLSQKRKVTERSHIRRTKSLMHINEELNREIKELKRSDAEELGLVDHRLSEQIKELNGLYDISSFREAEADIRKHQDHIETLIKKTATKKNLEKTITSE